LEQPRHIRELLIHRLGDASAGAPEHARPIIQKRSEEFSKLTQLFEAEFDALERLRESSALLEPVETEIQARLGATAAEPEQWKLLGEELAGLRQKGRLSSAASATRWSLMGHRNTGRLTPGIAGEEQHNQDKFRNGIAVSAPYATEAEIGRRDHYHVKDRRRQQSAQNHQGHRGLDFASGLSHPKRNRNQRQAGG
jgi:hypothetical protein